MSANLAALAYLVAGVLFILALRGLSNPETSRRGNLFGMIGMAVAVATTLAAHPPVGFATWVLVVVGVALAFASVNIFGGFLVTQRMLAMFHRKQKKS